IDTSHRHLFPPEIESEICAQYELGESSTALAQTFACSEETIRKLIMRCGHQMRPKRKLDARAEIKVVREYNKGLSTTQIGANYGVARGTIRNSLLRAGGRLRGAR